MVPLQKEKNIFLINTPTNSIKSIARTQAAFKEIKKIE
jgi:hypothetical protein